LSAAAEQRSGGFFADWVMSSGPSFLTRDTTEDVIIHTTYDQDIFTGSLLYFKSMGYNRIGVIDFSQILVPVGEWGWASLCRKHFPKVGDEVGTNLLDVLDPAAATYSDSILSAGVNGPANVILHYPPAGSALDQVPDENWAIWETFAEHYMTGEPDDLDKTFLEILLERVEAHYGLSDFAAGVTTDFEHFLNNVDLDTETPGNQPYTDPDGNGILTLKATQWFGPAETWPKALSNYPYIEFWHRFDTALEAEGISGMGPELLGDDAWMALFDSGDLTENPNIHVEIWTAPGGSGSLPEFDQLGTLRPASISGDIGAIENP
jgi:hypothetical protein